VGSKAKYVRLQVLAVSSMKMTAFWDIASIDSLKSTYVSEMPAASIIRAKMKAVHTPEISVYFSKTTQCYIPKGSHRQSKIFLLRNYKITFFYFTHVSSIQNRLF
jgi:hypothetical protein